MSILLLNIKLRLKSTVIPVQIPSQQKISLKFQILTSLVQEANDSQELTNKMKSAGDHGNYSTQHSTLLVKTNWICVSGGSRPDVWGGSQISHKGLHLFKYQR